MRLNLFVVESPLQALSACEAKDSLCAEDKNIILVKLWGGERRENDEQIKKVVGVSEWEEVIFFSTYSKFSVGMHVRIIKNIAKISRKFKGKICNIFIGDFYSVWMHYLKCAIRSDKIFLLDDGNSTIAAYNDSISRNINWPKKDRGHIRQCLHDFIYSYFYNKKYAEKKIIVFSSFHLCDYSPFVIKNEYIELKKRMSEKIVDEKEVYYFGAKYSEVGVMCRKDELAFLGKVVRYYENLGKIFIYIPHRDEEGSKVAAIKKLGNVSVKNLNMPAELYLVLNEKVPLNIGGAYTSVLQNVKVMFDCFSILSFRIPHSILLEKRRGKVIEVYANYSKSGIDVIDLTELNVN
ncbi:hypothetical protein SAMN05661010_00118 [Modicisalibacter muralis]|uniref:Glycosyltransferase family 52 n=1 Tax=Modicisalibacter muralis TaxID=119000 RepID=A0A1G9EU47_9GAMM|nr:polysialyltransferase family glycosyltransferase [Halomonas muralis]SDK79692.1 hypothetical protein SAMN05661010_00118 [Halomonas muralis]